jgi:hypothetical protein
MNMTMLQMLQRSTRNWQAALTSGPHPEFRSEPFSRRDPHHPYDVADDIDAPLLALLAQCPEAHARLDDIYARTDEARGDKRPPDVLKKTAEDDKLFLRTEKIGEYFRTDQSFDAMESMITRMIESCTWTATF